MVFSTLSSTDPARATLADERGHVEAVNPCADCQRLEQRAAIE